MKLKKVTYSAKNREDFSNQNRHIPHGELLKKAQVIDLRENLKIETLPDGRVIAKAINEDKKY